VSDEVIQGRRVSLVPLAVEHADELAGLLEDAFVRDSLGVGEVEGLRRRFAAWESRRSPDGEERWLNWVVRERADGRALGWVQATVCGATASVAYALLATERGRGAASDAVRAMIQWLRTELGVTDLTASIAPANLASAHVARAVGLEATDGRDEGEVIWAAKRAHIDRPSN
jgi:RimJ/RimL family protein N-acetyltransferase